jgi:hypothetical protein
MLQFIVAEKLGMCVSELQERMTFEELIGWSCYLEIKYDQEKAAMEKARRGR